VTDGPGALVAADGPGALVAADGPGAFGAGALELGAACPAGCFFVFFAMVVPPVGCLHEMPELELGPP